MHVDDENASWHDEDADAQLVATTEAHNGRNEWTRSAISGPCTWVQGASALVCIWPRDVKHTIDNLVAIVAEGDLIVFSFKRDLPDPKDSTETYTATWFDMMRIKDGKVAEHWDYGARR
jgi:predicted SnoaL-like aldol condensation-catalyzing enzyme